MRTKEFYPPIGIYKVYTRKRWDYTFFYKLEEPIEIKNTREVIIVNTSLQLNVPDCIKMRLKLWDDLRTYGRLSLKNKYWRGYFPLKIRLQMISSPKPYPIILPRNLVLLEV